MRQAGRLRRGRERAIGVRQVLVLGAVLLGVSAGSYLLGYRAGSAESRPARPADGAPLVPEEVREETLLDLLQRVEEAAAEEPLAFPEGVQSEEPPPLPEPLEPEPQVVEIPPPRVAPPPAEAADERPPRGTWAVQVQATTDPAEAAARVEALRAAGLEAWRSEAIVKGRRWVRVRVGGWASREEAEAHLDDIRAATGQDDAFVVEVE